jgi:hypothetical protein
MQGKKKFTEKLFTHFQLSDRVPVENFYRRLKEVLNLHWLYKATEKYYGREGQESIDPVVFFKLMLIGYLENLAVTGGSSARLACVWTCCFLLGMILMNLCRGIVH